MQVSKVTPFTVSNVKVVFFLQWTTLAFFIYSFYRYGINSYLYLSLFIYFCTGCLGITVTFHRYLSHRSFKMPQFLEYLFAVFGSLGGTGSPTAWVAIHKTHHKYSDTENDPHSPTNGVKEVFFNFYNFNFNKWPVRDLITNNFYNYLHLYYNLILASWILFWLVLDFKLFIYVVAIPIFLQIWISIISNIVNHSYGYRNFETSERSTNHFVVALLAWGEGWHNNHHRYPHRSSFQIKWWEIDISAFVIKIITTFSPSNKSQLESSLKP